jgi:quercetin dioxygenase-like cupin family protein
MKKMTDSEPLRARHVRRSELESLAGKVQEDGGELLLLSGATYGLVTSVMSSKVMPGSGPRRHKHPHAEIFVLHAGRGQYEVDGSVFNADAGDVVVIPPDAWHGFVNTGNGPLQLTAIHQNPRAVTHFEDGSQRD